MIQAILDHLWQSTFFVVAAGFLTAFFKANSARVRYSIWLCASFKFLLPLSILITAGTAVSKVLLSPTPITQTAVALDGATEPFSRGAVAITSLTGGVANSSTTFPWTSLLGLIWFVGFSFIIIRWLRHWLYLRSIVRAAIPLAIDAPLSVKSSPALLEPGLIGILHPTLLLPEDVSDQLSPTELETIIAHEVCHWRYRDNLTATGHMLVEAIFWFYPLVWWLETQLIAERERACDEDVVSSGRNPSIYAESILKVCKFYTHSPLTCAAGVSGADLKKRIEMIMESKFAIRLNAAKKGLLAACATIAIAAPLALGLMTAPPIFAPAVAQTTNSPHPGTEAALRHQIESMEKGQMDFDVMVPRLAQAARDQSAATQANIQRWGALKSITFRENDNGNDVYLVEFENQLTAWTIGPVQPDGKIGPTLFFRPAIKRDENSPSPGLEAAIRQELDGDFTGNPALEIMQPGLQTATQNQWKAINGTARDLGAVQSITFQNVNAGGWDVYHVTFANGTETVQAAPLVNGKLTGIFHSDVLLPHQPQHPGTEAWMRRHIAAVLNGTPNYEDMGPFLSNAVHRQWPNQISLYKSLGALQSLTFEGGGGRAMDGSSVDVYLATFQNGKVRWHIETPDATGKVDGTLFFQKLN